MKERISQRAGLVFCIIGFLLVGYALFDGFGGRIYQAWRGRQMDQALASLPPQTAPERRISYQPGSAIGRLDIPRIGISLVVMEGSDTDTLRLGVGRLRNSALPGEDGNVVLAAHRDTFFRPLRDIRHGDTISLRTPQGTFAYTVDWTKVVDPSDTELLKSTGQPELTLVTCYPFYYVGSAPQRFIVRALPPGAVPEETKPTPMPVAAAPRPAVHKVAVREPVAAAVVDTEPPVVVAPPKQHRVKGVFRKLGRVFGSHRAKLQ